MRIVFCDKETESRVVAEIREYQGEDIDVELRQIIRNDVNILNWITESEASCFTELAIERYRDEQLSRDHL